MSDLDAAFADAQARAKTLTDRPSNADMLELYALFKQATEGDVGGKRPGMMDMVGRAKYDAWSGKQGLTPADAMQAYIDKVAALAAS